MWSGAKLVQNYSLIDIICNGESLFFYNFAKETIFVISSICQFQKEQTLSSEN